MFAFGTHVCDSVAFRRRVKRMSITDRTVNTSVLGMFAKGIDACDCVTCSRKARHLSLWASVSKTSEML